MDDANIDPFSATPWRSAGGALLHRPAGMALKRARATLV